MRAPPFIAGHKRGKIWTGPTLCRMCEGERLFSGAADRRCAVGPTFSPR